MDETNLLRLAANAHEAGDLARAASQYRRILCLSPTNLEALYRLAMAQLQTGHFAQAARFMSWATSARPDIAKFHLGLGEALRSAGEPSRAREAFETALALDPVDPEIHNALGLLLRSIGDQDGSIARFETGLNGHPNDPTLLYNHAMTLQLAGRLSDAIAGYDAVLAQIGGFTDAHNNRARAWHQLGRYDKATRGFRRVLVAEPGYAIAWNNLGVTARETEASAAASTAFKHATVLDPGYGEAHSNLGTVEWALGRADDAIKSYRTALERRPDLVDAGLNLASALATQGHFEDSIATYDAIADHNPADSRIRVRRAFALPEVYGTGQEITEARARINAFLDSDVAAQTVFDDPVTDVGAANFRLVYQGFDDRSLAEKIARFYRRSCPRLSWTAPHCRDGDRKSPGRRPRVGICSKYLNRHTIGLLFEGVIQRLAARGGIELVILRAPGRIDDVSKRIDDAADAVIRLPADLARAQEIIAGAELDILLYTDIGLEPLTYFLAFARLAPIQWVTWGHPVTTGLDSLDGYLSADAFEPSNGEAHYTEGLRRIRNILMRYHPPTVDPDLSISEFGLNPGRTSYVCPQNLFKLHPDFDAWLGGILRADPQGRVVLVESAMAGWTEQLRARLSRTLGDVMDRVSFIPFLPTQRYFRLLVAADVILDPIHFGGGFTTFHALSLGTPVITARGDFQRSRFASGAYRTIGVEDLVAENRNDYVERAVALGQDPGARIRLSGRIRQAARALQDRDEPADELYDLFLTAFETPC